MSTFLDTSAIIAVLSRTDRYQLEAVNVWNALLVSNEELLTSNYIVAETCNLLHNRIGLTGVRKFVGDILPIIQVQWVDLGIHSTAMQLLMLSSRHGPNFVDCTSFAVMNQLGIEKAFTFDSHFAKQGFCMLPDQKL